MRLRIVYAPKQSRTVVVLGYPHRWLGTVTVAMNHIPVALCWQIPLCTCLMISIKPIRNLRERRQAILPSSRPIPKSTRLENCRNFLQRVRGLALYAFIYRSLELSSTALVIGRHCCAHDQAVMITNPRLNLHTVSSNWDGRVMLEEGDFVIEKFW